MGKWENLLWLLLLAAALLIIWLAIKGVNWLTEYVKERKRIIDEETDAIAEETEKEERKFLKKQRTREMLEHVDYESETVPADFEKAIAEIDANELSDILMQKAFGNTEPDTKSIMATKSAFVKEPETVVVAKGSGIMPKFAKKQSDGLSKSEKKIYDKIKQGS